VAAEVAPEPEPEPVAEMPAPPEAPRPSIRPIGETILHMPRREPAAPRPEPVDHEPLAAEDPLAAARRAQLDLLGLDDPGEGVLRPDRPKVLPYRSSGAAVPRGDLAERAARAGTASSFWDASAREVADAVSAIGVQSCGQCGLSLSASARFCRRCGTRQAQSA
ncbi:MAG TPA: zinc ribbon domain-containing protein, partial [Candidatus Limnocylindria bacterium]|nr:zinc ribbon domain-containing protein [Candidatus Limnocylindria bacterium]